MFGRRRTTCPHGGRRFPFRLPGRGRLGIASGRRTHRYEGWRRSPIRSDAFGPSGVKKSWAAADPGRHPGAPPVPERVQSVRARPGGPHGGGAVRPKQSGGVIAMGERTARRRRSGEAVFPLGKFAEGGAGGCGGGGGGRTGVRMTDCLLPVAYRWSQSMPGWCPLVTSRGWGPYMPH